jgi:flagellar biosynthetic protein FlhB
MASGEDRTEKPTARKKKEARKHGQVARSPELAGWISMLLVTSALPTFFGSAERRIESLIVQGTGVMGSPSTSGATRLLSSGLSDALAIALPVVGMMAGISLAVGVAQTGAAFSFEAAAPKLSNLSPLKGIKNLFSPNSLWQLVRQVLKLGLLSAISYRAAVSLAHSLAPTGPVQLGQVVGQTAPAIVSIVRNMALGGLLVAILDYAVQKFRMNRQLKMTKQEVKEEMHRYEGDPNVKRAVRRRQLSLSRLRMMAAVAGADVVITNPTHFAVALVYDPVRGGAPVVVAKGAGEVASRIREEANRNKVPIVEDPPLARAIYAACEIDMPVPRELYLAVARVLAFVFTLPALVKASGAVHRRRTSALVA